MKLIVILFAALAAAQSPSGEIQIQVTDPSGASVVATCKLVGPSSQSIASDSRGKCAFAGLAAGRYTIQVSRRGFATQTVEVDVAQIAVLRTITLALEAGAEKVDVVASTPLPGTDVPIDQIPAPVQTASALDIQRSGSLDLADLMNRRLNGVHVNENQENPFQPDINYRGYTASPLLGTPEGISVYMDGVRQNQPFADIVAWDLIPKVAISEMALMPGSDPLFGLNTLGGAISVQTKDGRTSPGTSLEISGGSFGRRAGQFENGGSHKSWSWYVAGNLFREDGWRADSPSEVRQAFGKLGYQHGKTSINLSFAYADNFLTGNGLQDSRFVAQDYSSVYSIPDITWNRSPSFNLSVRHDQTAHLTFTGNAYFRYIRADTTNGDINSESFDGSLYNLSSADVAALTAAGYKGFPITGNATTEPYPFLECIAQSLQQADVIDNCTGIITNTFTKQNNWGVSGQAAWVKGHNRFTAGSAWDRSSLTFQQSSQFGYLNPDRVSITPIDAFADGTTTQDGTPVDTRVDLHGGINTISFYAADALTLGKFTFTFSGRYNRTSIDNVDRLPFDPTGARGSLNGQYVFERFNPAAGFTYAATHFATLYFNYSEASRAPTAIELGCANPNEPCNLPNALVSDPPLKQVVTRTLEAGARGTIENKLRWSAGWFRGENYNDLLFVASEQTGFGYFTNFGQTRRTGFETSLNATIRHLTIGGDYTFLNATYQSPQIIDGGSNSSSDSPAPGLDGNITITPGDHIPQIPRNIGKLYADYQATSKLSIDLDFIAVGRSFARGNENNLDQPNGIEYLGPGYSPGYGVLNAGARYQIHKRAQLFVQIDNVLNHRYFTAAQLGPSPFDNSGNFVAQPFGQAGGDYPIRTSTFLAPGAPIGAWGGLRVTF